MTQKQAKQLIAIQARVRYNQRQVEDIEELERMKKGAEHETVADQLSLIEDHMESVISSIQDLINAHQQGTISAL